MLRIKRYTVFILILILLLCACGKQQEPEQTTSPVITTTVPETTAAPTEPSIPWIESAGMPWDEDGVLLELPLTIPDGMHYHSSMEFCGDLLLWSIDDHRAGHYALELCLVDLLTGQVMAQRDIGISDYIAPQALGDSLYICDDATGLILQLNDKLETADQWNLTPAEGDWFMGSEQTVYQFLGGKKLYETNITTGEMTAVLEGDPDVWAYITEPGMLYMDYYRVDTGAKAMALLDLSTGAVMEAPSSVKFNTIKFKDDVWLCSTYRDQNQYFIYDGDYQVMVSTGEAYLEILPGKQLLLTGIDGNELFLYDLQGKLISKCRIFDEYCYYSANCLTYNEEFDGYFLWLSGEAAGGRLLFWDLTKEIQGEDLSLDKIPEPDEAQQALAKRVDELSRELGLNILIGEDCDTVFDDFIATRVTDNYSINVALDTLQEALSSYPEGFIRQLRFDSVQGITIQLVSDLIATGNGREGDGYIAFAQQMWDHYLVVIDIDDVGVDTYYHEFSHIIDSYLAWDAMNREDALFSEEGWNACNPSWFAGYTYDYSWEQTVKNYDWFIDTYSTISPTEDRARVMEYAMSEYGGSYFTGRKGLEGKLDYYCRCIRDAFDTTGWAETVLWEQYN